MACEALGASGLFLDQRDPLFERMRWGRSGSSMRRSKPRSVAATRMWLAFLALMLVFGAGFAVAGALPPGPTVDVQVVPVAYGLDTRAGLFGLGVRNAHCSGGANAYTVAVGGFRTELSCAKTSGSRTRTVVVGLTPRHSYAVTIRAVQTRAGRSARAGTTRKLTVDVPDANSKGWQANG